MHKPLATVLSILDGSAKEDEMIAYFQKCVAPFSEGGFQRDPIEVVRIFETSLQQVSRDRFPRVRGLIAEKRAEHQRTRIAIDAFIKEVNRVP
jgi:hypothetical protein